MNIEIPEYKPYKDFEMTGKYKGSWWEIAIWTEYNWNRTRCMLMKKKAEIKDLKSELYDLKRDNKYLEEENKRLEKENKRLYKEMCRFRKELNLRKAGLK